MAIGDDTANLARYAADGSPEHGLAAVRRLRRVLDDWERSQVAAARGAGWNWGEIARVLGRSRQAVHQRYRDVAVTPRATPMTRLEVQATAQQLYEQKLRGTLSEAEWLRAQESLWEQLP